MVIRKLIKEDIHKCLIKSSNIKASEYDAKKKELLVTFKNDSQYIYKGVHEADYLRFEIAESNGKVLNSIIKKNYQFEKLDEFKKIDEDLYKPLEENKEDGE